jgi:hypothetical protein
MPTTHSSTDERKPILCDGKVIGTLENGRFIKHVVGSRHKLRKPEAWAIDAAAFDDKILPNASEVVIVDKETGTTYRVATETFSQHKFKFNRGFGNQYACLLKHFEVEKDGVRQLSLFGGQQ